VGKQPTKSVEDKNRIVLAVLRGEISIAEAAR
jgi:transposase-like protein